MRTFRPLLALAVAGAALFAAPGAQAAVNCFGPDTMYLCVITPTVNLKGSRTECVYVGGDTCQNVTIPWPTTSGSVGIYCGGMWTCD
jgi:hypothetical protein